MKVSLLLCTSFGFGQALKLNSSSEGSGDTPKMCHDVKCPPKFVPKRFHHEIQGATPAQCCDATCEHKVATAGCGPGYKRNSEYYGNIGVTDQVCCDKTCNNEHSCDRGYKPLPADTVGLTSASCCAATCSLFDCAALNLTADPSKSDSIGNSSEECCDNSCYQWTCQNASWFPDASKYKIKGASDEECCMPGCGNRDALACSPGYGVPDDRKDIAAVNGTHTCCEMKCEAYACDDGWSKNSSAVHEFGSSNEECCIPTCAQFACDISAGWANDSSRQNLVGDNSSTCCKPTCRQWTCDSGSDWLTPDDTHGGGSRVNVTGDSNSECCVRSCHFYTCIEPFQHRPNSNTSFGSTADACCEPKNCTSFRDSTKMSDGEYCNNLNETICESRYSTTETADNLGRTGLIPCKFDSTYDLCRYATESLTRCWDF